MDKLKDAAARERRAYNRAWRAKNRDRVKKYNQDFWQRRAKKKMEVDNDASNANDQADGTVPSGE